VTTIYQLPDEFVEDTLAEDVCQRLDEKLDGNIYLRLLEEDYKRPLLANDGSQRKRKYRINYRQKRQAHKIGEVTLSYWFGDTWQSESEVDCRVKVPEELTSDMKRIWCKLTGAPKELTLRTHNIESADEI